jgi:hypothetical protein
MIMSTRFEVQISLGKILLGIAVIACCIWLVRSCGARDGQNDIARDMYPSIMESFAYRQGKTVSSPPLEKPLVDLLGKHVISASYSEGEWTAPDTIAEGEQLPVEISTAELDDGSFWIKADIGGDSVMLKEVSFYRRSTPRRSWKIYVGFSNCVPSPYTFGVGYEVCEISDFGLTASLATDKDLTWIAGDAGISRRIFSDVSVRFGIGHRLFVDEGMHMSIGVQFSL